MSLPGCARPSNAPANELAGPEVHASGFRAPLAPMAMERLQLPPLLCRHPQSCPPAVGELVAVTLKGTLNCTATLISPRIVLTASHCVPWENLSPDRKFNGNCWVRWPEAPASEKGRPRLPARVPCARLLSATTIGGDVRSKIYDDHALIELAEPQTGREPMTVAAHDAREKNDSALLYGVNLGSDAHLIEFEHCTRDDRFTLPGGVSHDEGTIIFPSCHVLHGYSGGPILSPLSRQIIGVVSGVIDFDAGQPDKPLTSVGTRVRPWPGGASAPQ